MATATYPSPPSYTVPSFTRPAVRYTTTADSCTCPDAVYRRRVCKHQHLVRAALAGIRPTPAATCGHCGHTGADVVESQVYTGGRGYSYVDSCTDSVACWARGDAAHGL